MDLSYFIQPVHPLTRDYREVLEEDLESVILADTLGFKEAFIGEHFTDFPKSNKNTGTESPGQRQFIRRERFRMFPVKNQ